MKTISRNIILLLTLSGLIFSSCDKKKPQAGTSNNVQRAMEVKAVVAVPRELENKIFTTGSVLANEEVEIRAEVPGRVTSINFKEGSMVRKGDLLVTINDSELQAQLKKLLLDQKLAQDDVYRKEKLLEMKAVSQEELDVSTNNLGVISANIDLTRAQIDKTRIYAPFNGRIGLRYVSPGGYISPSNLIARMQEIDPVKVEFTIPEKYLGSIKNGQEVQFSVAGTDSTFTGTIYAIEPSIDAATRSFTVRAHCANSNALLVPGAFAKVSIILENIQNALVLPSDALIADIRGEKVFVCRNGKAGVSYVIPGIRTESEVEITDGLNPNDTVIVSGLLNLRDGTPVIPRVDVKE